MTRLRELRNASGKSRAQVAADFDMSERHIYRLETGATPLKRMHALAFARYYGVPVSELDDRGAA